jgi:hypothetical protein
MPSSVRCGAPASLSDSIAGHVAGRWLAALLALALVPAWAEALAPVRAGTGDPANGELASARRVALGIASPDGRDLARLDALTAAAGRPPAIWVVWSQWGLPSTQAFPSDLVAELADRGITPMVWWEPVDPRERDAPTYARHATIVRGDHDAYVRAFARDARDAAVPVLLRFMHEANGSYFPWSVEAFDNSPQTFIAAWRHVRAIFREEGAENVRFVWSVAKQRCPGGCDPYAQAFPGDDDVDVIGVSSHNWGAMRGRWVSLHDGSRRVVRLLRALSERPMMLVEVAANAEGGDKATWIREGFPEVHARLPDIEAIVYLDADLRDVGHPDWRLDSPPEALAAWAEVAALEAFSP